MGRLVGIEGMLSLPNTHNAHQYTHSHLHLQMHLPIVQTRPAGLSCWGLQHSGRCQYKRGEFPSRNYWCRLFQTWGNFWKMTWHFSICWVCPYYLVMKMAVAVLWVLSEPRREERKKWEGEEMTREERRQEGGESRGGEGEERRWLWEERRRGEEIKWGEAEGKRGQKRTGEEEEEGSRDEK